MKAIIYYKENEKVAELINNVTEVGEDFIVGEKTLKGINTDKLSIVAVEDDVVSFLKIGDDLPAGLVDKKSALKKATLEDIGKELIATKLENLQMKSTLNSLGKELASAKIEIINLKGGAV